ncbi:MAG: hypothetical protein ABJB47_00770 [Actinomycetota bacterium]
MALAERAARAYAPNERLAVFAVAGSVGSGLADRFSDLEVDCYWHEPPDDRDRRSPIELLGGQLEGFWEYDADEEEWSEEYILGTLSVTVSNFVIGTAERWLDAVTLQADTDPVKHMRLAASSVRGRCWALSCSAAGGTGPASTPTGWSRPWWSSRWRRMRCGDGPRVRPWSAGEMTLLFITCW